MKREKSETELQQRPGDHSQRQREGDRRRAGRRSAAADRSPAPGSHQRGRTGRRRRPCSRAQRFRPRAPGSLQWDVAGGRSWLGRGAFLGVGVEDLGALTFNFPGQTTPRGL